MRLAGAPREGRRHRDHPRAGMRHAAVEIGEAHVVTDGHAKRAPRRRRDHGAVSRTIGARLAEGLAVGQVHVEHVDLVVGRDHAPR